MHIFQFVASSITLWLWNVEISSMINCIQLQLLNVSYYYYYFFLLIVSSPSHQFDCYFNVEHHPLNFQVHIGIERNTRNFIFLDWSHLCAFQRPWVLEIESIKKQNQNKIIFIEISKTLNWARTHWQSFSKSTIMSTSFLINLHFFLHMLIYVECRVYRNSISQNDKQTQIHKTI